MKSSKPKTLSQKRRRALEEQVKEYVNRYHPQRGTITVAINPSGTLAVVCSGSRPNVKRCLTELKGESDGNVAR